MRGVPSEPRQRRGRARGVHPLAAAALVILGAVAITFYAFNKGLPFVHGFRVHAVVSQAQNLRGDSPVRIAGVQVGTVTGVQSGPGHSAVVNMELDDHGLPIHTDATVRVRPRIFLEGGSYVDLDPGSPSAPHMKDGATIPLRRTSVAVQAFQVLSTFDLATRSSLRTLVDTLGAALAGGGAAGLRAAIPHLAPAFEDLAWIAQSARGSHPHDLSQFVASAASVTAALAQRSQQLADLTTNLNTTAGALASTGDALGQSLSQLDLVLREAPAELSAVDRALPPLTVLSRLLDPALHGAPVQITQVTTAVNELGALVAPSERPGLIAALRGVFVQLPTMVHDLGGLFPVVKPIADCLHKNVTPVLNAQVPDGSLSSGQPVWQEFVHALAGLAGASQDFDANGHWLRILGGAGLQSFTTVLPGVGKLIGSLPGASPLLGARPQWFGKLSADDFHPEAPCATQPQAQLASATAAPDLLPAGAGAATRRPRLTKADLQRLIATRGQAKPERHTSTQTPKGARR